MVSLSRQAPRNRAFVACTQPTTVVLRDLHPLIRQAGRSSGVLATGSVAPGDQPRHALSLPGATRLTLVGEAAGRAKLRSYVERLTDALDSAADSAVKLGVALPLLMPLVNLDAPELVDVAEALTDIH